MNARFIPRANQRFLAMAISAAFVPVAIAGPDSCTTSDGGMTLTCEGNQSQGVSITTPPSRLDVQQLNQDIAPVSGTPGIRMISNGIGNVLINSGTPSSVVEIKTSGNAAYGIEGITLGTPSLSAPPDAFLGVPLVGVDPNVSGGTVTINSYSNIVTDGANAHAIRAYSASPGYPESVLSQLRSFSETGFSFAVTSVRNTAGDVLSFTGASIQVRGHLIDANGTIVRDGNGNPIEHGTFTIYPDGHFTVQYSPAELAAQAALGTGQTLSTAVSYSVLGTRAGNTQADNSQLVVTFQKDSHGDLMQNREAWFDTFGVSSKPAAASSPTLFPDLQRYVAGILSDAMAGGAGNSIAITSNGALETKNTGSYGIDAYSQGGTGTRGRDGSIGHSAGGGGAGSDGGAVSIAASGSIVTHLDASGGIVAISAGGEGGAGGDGGHWRHGQKGGTGGTGGTVTVSGSADITTSGADATGIYALSVGGNGGAGGSGSGAMPGGGGGFGGKGGEVSVVGGWNVTTGGDYANGIWARSIGGNAGAGGSGGWLFGKPGSGGDASDGDKVTLHSSGAIETSGKYAYGLYAQSVGGFGGPGGTSWGLFWSFGGDANSGGSGGDVDVRNEASGTVSTNNLYSHGIFAQSIGGGGGSGGGRFGLLASVGGDGAAGGNGGMVTVVNEGAISTGTDGSQAVHRGDYAHGIYAQSVGGGGGDGGGANGLVGIGGNGSGTSDGGKVDVTNRGSINTFGLQSYGIYAQSIGGGGGDGGHSGGLVSIGGDGGGGGNADTVKVVNEGSIHTREDESHALFAQSVGGGGGAGGDAVAVGAEASVSIGGKGGTGGNGSDVTVTNTASGSIVTDGERAHAIFAQSIGGGGGNGGFAISGSAGSIVSLSVAIGGSGGTGGDAGAVKVLGGGSIYTYDKQSYGIFAQSVGGGGGSGGFAIAGSYSGSKGLNLSLGGEGGGGGVGKTVDVGSAADPFFGSIHTRGDYAHGIVAQSIGGSGGDGGFAIAGSVMGGITANISIGGNGGTGNDSDVVTVHSVGDITTGCSQAMADTSGCDPAAGNGAHAILAQSIGGSGGNGGFSISASLAGGTGLDLGFGGTGGGASDGNTVNVGSANSALGGTLTTYGDRAHGIVAQSIGGGGGNGGASITGSLLKPVSISFGFGGDGGAGGKGGLVNVYVDSDVMTWGRQSHGVLAQSIGGGGGAGGMAFSGAVSAFGGLTLTMGGDGGNGNSADTVTVVNSGRIETWNEYSYGIFAQSIGGGGGAGGSSGAVMANFSSLVPIPEPYPKVGVNIALTLGGDGGTGGKAGDVVVTNDGRITTHQDYAYGILAQSIGGGGGDGGSSVAATANFSLPDDPSDAGGQGGKAGGQVEVKVDFAMAIGGKGASGNVGGNVTVTNRNAIDTYGVGAHGIFVQSVGGGGGAGGDARSMILSIDPSNWQPDVPEVPDPTSFSVGATLSVGGRAGTGEDAGAKVEVTNTGSIVTRGADAFGIFAQSIGGGGGVGGSGYHGLDWEDFGVSEDVSELLDFVLPIQEEGDVNITVGGAGGASGDGKEVFIDHTGSITTTGQGSVAVLAQSIGGGGGIGGIGAIGDADSKQLSFGGDGGSSGNGGLVHVITHGEISTSGVVAHGIFAQSIGGGGGYAGNVDLGVTDFGNAFAFAGDGGNAGNGGEVIVDNFGNIVTRARGAMGIFAQSVGGGGGLGGTVGAGIGIAGSVGGTGEGGKVTVAQTGDIRTYGIAAHGIVAQSNGGFSGGVYTGSSGLVTVNSSGNILVTGADAHGIVAQSLGGASNGNVIVNINDGSVTGGSGTGVGIMVLNGASNVITNRGTVSALSGMALSGGAAAETLNNHGTLTGNVDLGAGSNTISNLVDATFNPLANIMIGAGRSFSNDGTLSPGGSRVPQTTLLTGNLQQNAGGAYNVDLSLAGRSSDRLNVSGSAQLGGSIRVTPIDTGSVQIGNWQRVVLSAAGGVTSNSLSLIAPASPIVHYALSYPSSNEVAISSLVDFSPASLGNNGRQIGAHLNAILAAGGSSSLAPYIAALVSMPDEARLRIAYEKLGPGALGTTTTAATTSSLAFNDAMHSCRQRDGDYRFIREGECSWVRFGGSIRDQERNDQNPGYRQDVVTMAGGFQKAVRENLHLGFGASYQQSALNSVFSDVNGERFEGGMILKQRYDATRLSLSFSAGYGHYNTRRLVDLVAPGTYAQARPTLWSSSLHGRISHDIMASENAYIRPMLGLGVSYVSRDAYEETGAGGANLRVEKANDTFVSLHPAIEFGGENSVGGEGTLLRHYVRVGMTQFLGSNERHVTASLEGAPSGVQPFTVTTKSKKTYADLAIGVDILRKSGTTIRLEYTGQFSNNSSTNAIGVKVAMPF
ncbi:autotransporter outer membrane beta-barrel domain-containing protein [Ferribacterium limneticum]|uniref:autotransporter outer membrane beta-barrel domain-containing protein n=1 Tax=Ferribacterium limneticum TaxID=76259 RepID=UPI001CFBAA84|nr:autotransporter outer membrane beta-barrel domain-containing protein [Ferribacterium limneticum]UCV28774.1 hypothetical protein KI617_01295 [Ferribacterium limneticum]UCV32691.1 hypothetical protein KI608_01295 [Ferribacterium limneticum]